MVALVSACGPRAKPVEVKPQARPNTFNAARVRSYTDTFAATAIADSPSHIWVGSPHGLLRWDGGRYTVLTTKDGLPSDRVAAVTVDGSGVVWVATPKGLGRLTRTWVTLPVPPVGAFLTGLVPSADGKLLWAGGPDGLARLRNNRWERFLPDVGVTSLTLGMGGVLWVGTSGHGILRIPRAGDRVEAYGPAEGNEVDVVRGLAVLDQGVIAVGEGPSGPRAAFHDGTRFYSYQVEAPQVLEWAARAGAQTHLGAGETVYEVAVVPVSDPKAPPAPLSGPVKLVPAPVKPVRAPRPLALKPQLTSAALDDKRPLPPADPALVLRAPRLDTQRSAFTLPEGVTIVRGSERGLLVGTRFRGAVRVENGVVRDFRTGDLAASAERITVACRTQDDCYLATGGVRAWRFDSQAFEPAPIDPEPDSRVLAVLSDARSGVLAIHRGPNDSQLRISSVDGGNRWTPISMQAVKVPVGPPSLTFAELSPDGHLWVGLRYLDKERDQVDFGAAEIVLDTGRVVYHRQGPPDDKSVFGFALPQDMVAMYWKSPQEAWFATRQGAARLLDGKVRVFTENDGMESELISDIGGGTGDEVWVATRRGTGRFDGRLWRFPKMGPFYLTATSLGRDAHGNAFIGTIKGVHCVGDCSREPIDAKRGLLDDAVLDLTVDPRGRVWVLTSKGISIVDP